jgi:hypothetical protein
MGTQSVRIVYMGTATHDEELDFLQPIAESLQRKFGRQVRFDVVGVASRGQLARCFHRVTPEEGPASQTYPGFVEWFCRQHWDIAVSPLIDNPFNRCKSAIKLFDYAALALPVVASQHAEYDAAFGGDHGVQLVENTVTAWCDALSRLVMDAENRRRVGQKVVGHYRRHHILGADPQLLRGAIRRALATRPAQRAA